MKKFILALLISFLLIPNAWAADFPTAFTNAIDGVTEIVSKHLNNLEWKVGIDGSTERASLDYKIHNLGWIDIRDYLPVGYVTDGSVDYSTYLQTAANAAAGKTLLIPPGSWKGKFSTSTTGSRIIGMGKYTSILIAPTASDDILTIGQNDTMTYWYAVKNLGFSGGAKQLRINNISPGEFEDLLFLGGVTSIYGEGPTEALHFLRIQMSGFTSYGFSLGNQNSSTTDAQEFQKCSFRDIILAGASGSTSLYLKSGVIYGTATHYVSGYSDFKGIVSQGAETRVIDTDYCYNLIFERITTEVGTLSPTNTHTSILLGANTGVIRISDSQLSGVANDATTYKYGIHALGGVLRMFNVSMGGAAGTSQIYFEGGHGLLDTVIVTGGSTSGVTWVSALTRNRTLFINVTIDGQTAITTWPEGTNWLGVLGDVGSGLAMGAISYQHFTNGGTTIPTDGTGAHAAYTINTRYSYFSLNCQDTDGCTITMGETNASDGQVLRIVNNSANHCDFSDTPGVSELAGAFAMGQYSTLQLVYQGDRWVELGRSAN